jgi:hypothetical protein
MTAFWDIVPCSLIEVDRRFRGSYCLHHQGDHASIIALIMDALYASETSVYFNETIRRYIPECYLHSRRRENLKSQEENLFQPTYPSSLKLDP